MFFEPVMFFGSTSIELKCIVCNNVPSLINPFRGAAHPSATVCNQLTSISVKRAFGNVSASALNKDCLSLGTNRSTISSPSG